MTEGQPPTDFVSIVSLIVGVVSLIAAIVSAGIASQARKDAKGIAEVAHDEWAQQKWFDLYFSTNSAHDAMEKLQADSVVQKSGSITVHGGGYQDRANEVIRVFREIQAMAMVFPQSPAIDMLCAATSGFVDDPMEMLSNQRLRNLMDAMNEIREKALVNPSVLKRVIK